MIVEPDFLDHWRTRMFVGLLDGDEMAPFYLIRLWAHCQVRRSDTFRIPVEGIKALCHATCDAAKLEKALIDAEYISRDGDSIAVLKWAEQNASLLAAWDNGNKGGRPKKETQAKPMGYETGTQAEPTANPGVTDKSREEKIRENKAGSAKRRTQLPEDFTPNETGIATAKAKCISLQDELQKFKDFHTAKGSVMLDWQAAWRTWCGNAKQFAPRFQASGPSPPNVTVQTESAAEYVARKEAEKAAEIAARAAQKGPTPEQLAAFKSVGQSIKRVA